MGAWGFGIWDNDCALDVMDEFEELTKEQGMEPEEALFQIEYRTSMSKIYALADMYRKYNVLIPIELAILALYDDIDYSDSDDPVLRRSIIEKFQAKIRAYNNKKCLMRRASKRRENDNRIFCK